jgi:dTDP-4-amino-4,6-dideoxygalactose transaminase
MSLPLYPELPESDVVAVAEAISRIVAAGG